MADAQQGAESDSAIVGAGWACFVAGMTAVVAGKSFAYLSAGPFLSVAFGIGVALVIRRRVGIGLAMIAASLIVPELWFQLKLRAIDTQITTISAEPSSKNSTGKPKVEAPVLPAGPTPEQIYAGEMIRIYDIRAKYYETYSDGKVPGVDFKLKNEGDKTLERIRVLVGFKDASGKVIAEDTFVPISKMSIYGDSDPLKPGFIWAQERGKFFSAKSVPSEWDGKSVVVSIDEVEFSGAE